MPRVKRSDGGAIPDGEHWEFSSGVLYRMDREPPPRITIVAAPAGSGKAPLIGQWLARRPGQAWVWVNVEPDDDPAALIGAVRPDDTCLVLDGLELLDPAARERLSRAAADLAPAVRTFLISRDAGLPASEVVRLAGDIEEITTADLWWPEDEIPERLAPWTGTTVTGEQAHLLHRRTGGWPAGVLILARALRHGWPPLDTDDAHPDIVEFVTHEVLDRLPDPVRDFVLATCVLADLDPTGCAALAPGVNPHAMLDRIHRHGLLGPGGLRYHTMIRTTARHLVRAGDATGERRLLRTAAEQARRAGDDQAATSYLLDAGDWDAALDTLADAAGGGFRGWAPVTLRAHLERLPATSWSADPRRRALVAYTAAMNGDQLFAAEVIQQTPPELVAGTPWWPVLTHLIQAICVSLSANTRTAHQAATAALDELAALGDVDVPALLGAADRPTLECIAHLLAARAALFDGDMETVRRHLDLGWGQQQAQPPRHLILVGLGTDAVTATWAGDLTAAQRRVARAQRLAAQAGLAGHGAMSLVLLARVLLLRSRGRGSEALDVLDAGAETIQRNEAFVAAASGGQPHLAATRILRAALYLDSGDMDSARAALDELAAEGDDAMPATLDVAQAITRARLHLLSGDATAAEKVLAGAPAEPGVVALQVAAAVRRRDFDHARDLIARWPTPEYPVSRLRRLLASAGIAVEEGRASDVAADIEIALTAAEPEGHVQVFLDCTAAVRAATSALLQRSTSPWRRELARRLAEVRAVSVTGEVPPTRRERVVLEYLATPLTHAQIATRLFVSENTLKSHCRNLYRKLGVTSRGDAVGAARVRGWLPPASVVLDVTSPAASTKP